MQRVFGRVKGEGRRAKGDSGGLFGGRLVETQGKMFKEGVGRLQQN